MNRKDQDTAQTTLFCIVWTERAWRLNTAPAVGRRCNAKTETWKKQSGSLRHGAGLYGTELRLRARRGQEGRDLADSSGSRTWRHILRYCRSLRSIHERRVSGRSSCSLPRSGGDRNEVRLGAESGGGWKVDCPQ